MGINQFNRRCLIKHRILIMAVAAGLVCDPMVYNEIYIGIVRNTLGTKATRKDMEIRNKTIEVIRKLCRGQVSDFEKHE